MDSLQFFREYLHHFPVPVSREGRRPAARDQRDEKKRTLEGGPHMVHPKLWRLFTRRQLRAQPMENWAPLAKGTARLGLEESCRIRHVSKVLRRAGPRSRPCWLEEGRTRTGRDRS